MISELEKQLRKKFGVDDGTGDLRNASAKEKFQYLGAFWPQWNLHKRKCDRTGKNIISIFRPDCPYQVWDREEWIAHSNPPSLEFDFGRSFFDQAWELFQKCPIPNNFQSHNQNCEYTDDWYYSKNCYLCHSGQNCEDCRYCYEGDKLKNVYYGVSAFNSEVCYDLINSDMCFNGVYLVNCKNVYDSAFLYDCRGCSDCLFCVNLRDKKYCFENKQLTKEEFELKKREWDFSSLEVYLKAKKKLYDMMRNVAWHRALQIDRCENSSGCFIKNAKDCVNCYLLSYNENSVNNCFSGPNSRWTLDSLGTVGSELTYLSTLPVYSYEVRYSFNISHCRFVEYSTHLLNCNYCFGCCGLVNEKYCIFNKKYSEAEYKVLREKIIQHMKDGGEFGRFFPPHFAANPYEESFSGFHFPLEEGDGNKFRHAPNLYSKKDMPNIDGVFWDDVSGRYYQIEQVDVDFAKRLKAPAPFNFYMHHIQDNFRLMPFKGELRDTVCAKSGVAIKTNWPKEYDGRILSEEEYVKFVR